MKIRILDLAVANRDGGNVGVIFGYGDGNFSNITTYPTGDGSGSFSIASGDFNKDSWIDITVDNRYSQTVGVFLGSGNGSFSSQRLYSTNSRSDVYSIAIGDINNDTRLDIAVTDWRNSDGAAIQTRAH
jgi:hypothetical protein